MTKIIELAEKNGYNYTFLGQEALFSFVEVHLS